MLGQYSFWRDGWTQAEPGIDNYEFLIGETAEKAELCENTDGCFILCGDCLPKQKLSFFKTFDFFKSEACIELCVPQCVCPYSYEFDSIKGCVKT